MPKINNTHIAERIQEHIEKMERGEEIDIKKDKTLLDEVQQQALKDALAHQQQLKKTHKRPKTQAEKDAIGWKDIREVRIEFYKTVLDDLKGSALDDIRELQRKRELKAAKIYLDAYFKAEDGTSRESTGNIALTRAGFNKANLRTNKRDKEVWDIEEVLKKQIEAEMTKEKREQLELVREQEKLERKGLKERKR
jgi:hypothetical protein